MLKLKAGQILLTYSKSGFHPNAVQIWTEFPENLLNKIKVDEFFPSSQTSTVEDHRALSVKSWIMNLFCPALKKFWKTVESILNLVRSLFFLIFTNANKGKTIQRKLVHILNVLIFYNTQENHTSMAPPVSGLHEYHWSVPGAFKKKIFNCCCDNWLPKLDVPVKNSAKISRCKLRILCVSSNGCQLHL